MANMGIASNILITNLVNVTCLTYHRYKVYSIALLPCGLLMVRLGRSPYRLTRDTAYTVNVILIGVMQLKYSLLNPEYFIGKNKLVFTLY